MYPIIQESEHYTITEQLLSMSDGIRLYTKCIVPRGAEKYPTVFIRTPYDTVRNGVPAPIEKEAETSFVAAGYAVVRQHCRSIGNSEGFCIPYDEKERNAGLDTLAHIRTLPFYNGEIYLWGQSYLSTVHLTYMDTQPSDIKGAALSIQTDRMFFRNYRNGCCYDFCNINWWLGMMKRQYPSPKQAALSSVLIKN